MARTPLARCGLSITPGQLHFRLLTDPGTGIAAFAGSLRRHQIAVRVLDTARGMGLPAVRISAPRRQDRHALATALGHPATHD
jgi:histidinol-phosphate/aromatic aminotransferase/cobyric acid decarboxylase-like protein